MQETSSKAVLEQPKNRGGRPRVAAVTARLPVTTMPATLVKSAKGIAAYDGISLSAFIRQAVGAYVRARERQATVPTEPADARAAAKQHGEQPCA